ncbi:hypothetical protein ACQ4PT_056065 [Festuca glaucescens]
MTDGGGVDGIQSGPRLPSNWNYGSVEKALRESSSRGEKCIFLPKQGQVFQTLEEAYEYFNMYSWKVGFGIRYGRSRVNAANLKSRQDLVCSCEGRDNADMSRSARCDCPCILSLLRSDDESWAVRRFFDEHNHPLSISCGEKHQCHQMRVAIDAELPDTRHRWCKWHVLRKAKESLGPVYSKNSSFKRELHELLDQLVSVEEFETRWAEIVIGNGLGDNEFLARAYENREMWAKPYLTDTFCAGMTSTQHSESANHVLKTYIPRSTPMHLFVSQFDRLITDRVADEGREEHATKQVNFLLRAGVPVEQHATLVYNRNLFERFYKELFHSGSLLCRADGEGTISSKSNTIFAQVLVHVSAAELPPGLIMKRWIVAAREGAVCNISGYGEAAASGADAASMHGMLHAAAMELVGMGTTSRQAFELAVDYISHAKAALAAMTVDDPNQGVFDAQNLPAHGTDPLLFDASVAAPPRVRSRGRPKELRFKSPI